MQKMSKTLSYQQKGIFNLVFITIKSISLKQKISAIVIVYLYMT